MNERETSKDNLLNNLRERVLSGYTGHIKKTCLLVY